MNQVASPMDHQEMRKQRTSPELRRTMIQKSRRDFFGESSSTGKE